MKGGLLGVSNPINENKAKNISDSEFYELYTQLTRSHQGFFKGIANKIMFDDRFLDFLIIFNYRLEQIRIPKDWNKYLGLYSYFTELKDKHPNHIREILRNNDSRRLLFKNIFNKLNDKAKQYESIIQQQQQKSQPNYY